MSTSSTTWDTTTHGPAPVGGGYDEITTGSATPPEQDPSYAADGGTTPTEPQGTPGGEPSTTPGGETPHDPPATEFDPAEHTVEDVRAYLAHGGTDRGPVDDAERARVIAAERAGQGRKSITGDE